VAAPSIVDRAARRGEPSVVVDLAEDVVPRRVLFQ
jgi:hypothetical protein